MTSIACKVTLNNETRRVLLESTRDTTFNKLNQVVRELFNQKLPSIYTLVYKDDEGDDVTLSSDNELQEAIRLMKLINSNYLRLTIVTGGVQVKDDESKSDEGNNNNAWSFVDKKETKQTDSKSNDDNNNNTSSTARPSLNMIQIISNICSTDSSLNEMLQKENIQTCLQRAFSNDDMLQDPEAMESIMKSLCEENAEFKEFYNKVTEKMESMNGPPAVHHGVTCDKSGMTPIIGNRYKKRNENYDLCESEYQKLSKEEQGQYDKIARPANQPSNNMPFPMMPPPSMMGSGGPGGMMPPPMMMGGGGGGGPGGMMPPMPEGMNMPQGMNPMMMMQMMQMMNGNGNGTNNTMPGMPPMMQGMPPMMQGMMNGMPGASNNNPWASMGQQNNGGMNMPQGMNPMMMMQMMQMMNGNGNGTNNTMPGMPPMMNGMPPMNPMMQGMMPPGMMPPSSGNDEEEPEDMREMIQMVCSRDQELHRLSQKTTIKNSLNTYFSITDANERKEVLQTLLQDNEFKLFFEKVNEKLEQLSMANMMGGMMGNDGNNPFYGMGGPGSGMGRGGSGGGPNMMFT
jgi:hypothetical protein